MKGRSKAKASKSKVRATRNRRPRRNPVQVNVRPVALQTGDSAEAMIPAVVKQTPESTEAVISVEVKRGKSVRKRAAVIPIAVQKRAPRQQDRSRVEARENSSRQHDYNRDRWSDPITDSIVSATQVLDRLVHLSHDFGIATIGTLESLSRAFFSRATVVAEAAEFGELQEIDFGQVMQDPRRAQIELRAA